jgi:hypothetical protein
MKIVELKTRLNAMSLDELHAFVTASPSGSDALLIAAPIYERRLRKTVPIPGALRRYWDMVSKPLTEEEKEQRDFFQP